MQTGGAVVWKLAQKVRVNEASPELVKLTNIYLDEQEYERLSQLEAEVLVKTRWHWTVNDRALSVDAFGADLAGLVLAEVELGPEERSITPPPFAVVDVTMDDRYSGSALAALDSRGAAELKRDVLRLALDHESP